MTNKPVRVVVADDHPVVRLSIESALDDQPAIRRVGSAADSTELMTLLEAEPCDVLVTDFAMPGGKYGDGMELLSSIKDRFPNLKIVIFTGISNPSLIRSLLAQGFINILSKADGLVHIGTALRAALAGNQYLSPAIQSLVPMFSEPGAKLSKSESEVMNMYLSGMSVNDIAAQLHRAKQTVSAHKIRAMQKLGITSEADLFKHASEIIRMTSTS